jgi:hypothetical protein
MVWERSQIIIVVYKKAHRLSIGFLDKPPLSQTTRTPGATNETNAASVEVPGGALVYGYGHEGTC